MTVKELIEKLSEFPPDTPVYKYDSEWGSDELDKIELDSEHAYWKGDQLTWRPVVLIS